ncbi:aspartate racemase [Lentzea sp. NBRC 105346]|uniref:aspartate/glutamate racemase family protein n=1 Tax=Lentzea sp. NBRC 105346 TaxID=3032205 RepID=UPI0024A1921F|nr:amino acid racemase [Lentzea sp. NBRC 105346]GLZ30943.1 aspartate racemase [Lentzea sp. NBRC 105346]
MTRRGRALKVGILGGMGPAATADFYTKLVRSTPAVTDQDHVPVVIWADPTIPDRTAALLGQGPDPSPWLEQGAHALVLAGAELLAIPCNTAHAFLDTVRSAASPVHVLDMVAETAAEVARLQPGATVGVLATTGTLKAELYQHALAGRGLTPLVPDDTTQLGVMSAIRHVKAGGDLAEARQLTAPALQSLYRSGATAVVAACTEIPLLLQSSDVVDATAVLARAVVRRALADVRAIEGNPCH